MENIIKAKDICKTYVINKRQNNVLKNVSLEIKEGEMIAVMGPSGSGKSTLLYCISGMDRMTSGEVNFCGRDTSGLSDKELAKIRLNDMGFIFQQMYMMKNLSVLDNIILPAVRSKKKSESRAQTVERARALMRKLGIDAAADNDINEVSGGQLQRACICRSMINDPKILFADEPTGALNRAGSDGVMEELLRLNSEGTTVMCVTHDPKVAAKCSRVLYLIDGSIVGEKELGHFSGDEAEMRTREKELNNWLMELGW